MKKKGDARQRIDHVISDTGMQKLQKISEFKSVAE